MKLTDPTYLRAVRKCLGLSLSDLATAININRNTYKHYETGQRTITADVLQRLQERFGSFYSPHEPIPDILLKNTVGPEKKDTIRQIEKLTIQTRNKILAQDIKRVSSPQFLALCETISSYAQHGGDLSDAILAAGIFSQATPLMPTPAKMNHKT